MVRVLFVFVPTHGHINVCMAIAKNLHAQGHEVVFTVNNSWLGKLSQFGYGEVLLEDPKQADLTPAQCKENFDKLIMGFSPLWKLPYTEKYTGLHVLVEWKTGDLERFLHTRLAEIIDQVKPDVIVDEMCIPIPAIEKSGIPWAKLVTFNPLFLELSEDTPPCGAGQYAYKSNKPLWPAIRKEKAKYYEPVINRLNSILEKHGVQQLDVNSCELVNWSKHLNIYCYPKAVDYFHLDGDYVNNNNGSGATLADERWLKEWSLNSDLVPRHHLPGPWFRLQSGIRPSHGNFRLPDEFVALPGKLVYFSMGSMATVHHELLQSIIDILAKSSHKFIISTGPNADKLKLAKNMYGESFLPQTEVLQLVDLMITHGGNNTLIECFYYAVPMIVLPLFSDQSDNAIRVTECGYGLNFNPYDFKGLELLGGIELLVNDEHLHKRMQAIAQEIKEEEGTVQLANRLVQIALTSKSTE